MGNQCCGAQNLKDFSEMGFTSAIPVNQTKKIQVQSTRFQQVMQSKDDIDESLGYFNQDRMETFILTLKPYNYLDSHESITIKLKIKNHDYTYKQEQDWKIDENVIIDPNNFETSIIRAVEQKSGQKYSIKVINFDDYEDYKFKQALYEVYTMQYIHKNCENSDNLIKLIDVYIVEGKDKKDNNFSLVMLMENCDSTLHEIIAFRKFHEWKWSHDEIKSIFFDLVKALGQLELNGVAHRDIRPHNIWYCSDEQKYKFGGFQDAKIIKQQRIPQIKDFNLGQVSMKTQENENLNTIRGVPDYMAPEVKKYLQHQQSVGKYNPFESDTYQLGLCLSQMLYLTNDIQEKDISDFITKCNRDSGKSHRNLDQKSYLDLIKLMLIGDDIHRLTQAELCYIVSTHLNQRITMNEDNVVQSMKFKKKLTGPDSIRVYRLIAHTYYELFDWEKWQEKMEEVFVTFENEKDQQTQGQILYEIAQGFMDINNIHNAYDYFMRASVVFNEAAHNERQNGNIDKCIQLYQLAFDSVRKANSGEDTYEGALLLENLANAFRLKGDYKKARAYLEETQHIIAQEKGDESLENGKILISVAKIYVVIGDHKLAIKRIKKAIKIIDLLNSNTDKLDYLGQSVLSNGQSNTKQIQILKASALSTLGEIQRLKGSYDKAQQNLEDALQIRQSLQGNGHLEVASTLENLGNVYFDLENYNQAKTYYEQALVIKKSKLGDVHNEIALTLNNLGNSYKHLGEHEKAQKFFTDALAILQQVHGDQNNALIGTTYGNLGILFKNQGNKQGAEHCLNKCVDILENNLNAEHPDQFFYRDHLSQI